MSRRSAVPVDLLDKERATTARSRRRQETREHHRQDRRRQVGSSTSQFVLPDQESVRDSKMTVNDVLAGQASKALGGATLSRFPRFAR